MKEIQFKQPSYDEWKEEAMKALKGKPFESLFTKTMEGITLEPLYTQQTIIDKLGDRLEKQIATIRSYKATDDFLCAQQIFGESDEQFFKNIEDSLNRGNQVLTIDSRVSFQWNDGLLTKLADILSIHPFKLVIHESTDAILTVFEKMNRSVRENVVGYVISEKPIILKGYPNIRTVCANTLPFHYNGASAVQELAIALAVAARYSKEADSFDTFTKHFFVHFAVDTQFFSEIAKLRAFKVLWKAFSSAFGVKKDLPVPIIAETSLRSYSKLDIYVNLLRAGNETLSALIGGADVFTVHPHDVLTKPTEQSIRIARNVALVLKEESYVANVKDPSGGSYYIESLTADFVEEAWALFLEIEESGGIDAYIQSGTLHSSIEEVNRLRNHSIETRKHSLIGTNIYANPVDELSTETNPLFSEVQRLATTFENLRTIYQTIQPKVAVLTYGKLKNFKARADFVSGFFATAGVVVEQSGVIESIETAMEWLNETNYHYVIIAASDEDTKNIVPVILESKREGYMLDVAGRFKEEESKWLANGLNGFIFAGQNIVEKLNTVAKSLKGVQS